MNTIIQTEQMNVELKKHKKVDMENVEKIRAGFKAIAEGKFKEI